MDRTEDDILIAIVEAADFERAKATIAGFAQWASYEDYRCEREGRLLGLAFAGQNASLAPISIDGFLAWSQSAGASRRALRLVDGPSCRNWPARPGQSEALLDAYVLSIAEDRASPRRASAAV